ncbi:MAG TPA: discoidin domain-containing protein [Caulobacteraceae bacterium]|nr:discoidin domain-containing protein [Caulobacteraceae bacterium]
MRLRHHVLVFGLSLAAVARADAARAPVSERLVVDLASGPTNRFDAAEALGAGIDGTGKGGVDELFTAHNVARMREAGLGPLTYRLRTELAGEAWHWGPEGTWSDPAHAQGYWTSSDDPKAPILTSWGYRLPRRGDTIDQANDDGFSRIDDGDAGSFWKSNPYLDRRYAGDDHPQWIVVCFDGPVEVDAARIAWARPYATRFEVQYWTGADEYDDEGRWATFPGGDVGDGQGGDGVLRLAAMPVRARFFRVLMSASSGTAEAGATDPRDAMGYAVRELGLGVVRSDGFHDAIRHAPDRRRQTVIYVSSTDPWHRAVDRDEGLEQPGLDRLFASGLANGRPAMVPVPVLYDTPENAAAEIRFLRRRGYPIARVELGEEPDGQLVSARDYGALYLETAAAVHAVDAALTVGGPSLQAATTDVWLQPGAERSWNAGLIAYLKARGRLSELGFFSFERYPLENLCGDLGPRLRRASAGLDAIARRLDHDGVPRSIPWFVTEYGLSPYAGEAEVELPGALANADIPARWLTLGGQGAFLFGYGPGRPYGHGQKPCAGDGELMTWVADRDGAARWPLPTFQAARLVTQDWAGPQGTDETFRVLGDADATVVAYALKRADGRLAMMLLNRDGRAAHAVSFAVRGPDGTAPLAGRLSGRQYSAAQFAWRAAGLDGHPTRSEPPAPIAAGDGRLVLPPYSITVVETAAAPPALAQR